MKFLKYKVELIGTNDDNATEEISNKLENDYENKLGIFKYGDIDIFAHAERNTLIIEGAIRATTRKECNAMFTLAKSEFKKFFTDCTKVDEMFVIEGSIV